MEKWLSKKSVRLGLYFFMPVFFASFVMGLGLTIIEAMNRLLPSTAGALLSPQRLEIEYLRWYIKAATLGGTAVAIITGLVIAYTLNRPLKKLEDALNKIATGNIEELNINTTNEFALLSKSFNNAVSSIKRHLLSTKDAASHEMAHGLERLEKLALLGGIAAIIAHEIKNPLASIKGLTQLMAEKAEQGSEGENYTRVMLEEIDRLDKVVNNLLYFTKPAKEDFKCADIRQLLKGVSTKAHGAVQMRIKIENDSDNNPIEIWMDEDRLGRAFLNLMINAIQASPEGEAVRWKAVKNQKSSNSVVFVTISNKGSFIPPEERERIFEPFYTTKGKGTGLGLAVARHIIYAHGGDIRVESNRGETSFIVELPIKKQ